MRMDQNRWHKRQARVGDDVGRLQPPPGANYLQQFMNRCREIAEVPQTRTQTQCEQRYLSAAKAVTPVDHQTKVEVQCRAGRESDELENVKRREWLLRR